MRSLSKGFSLLEAMLAVAIMGMVLAPLFLLEGTVFDGVTKITEQFRRYLFAHNFLYQVVREQSPKVRDYTLEQKKETPATTLQYRLKKVTDGAFKNQKNLYRQEVLISSQDSKTPKDSLVTYLFKPTEMKNEK